MTQYQSSKINAYIWLPTPAGAPVIFNTSSVQINSAVNTIPIANINLAIGRNVPSGLANNVEYYGSFLQNQTAVVYLRVKHQFCSLGYFPENWPVDLNGNAQYVKIFEGRIVYAAGQKTRGAATLEIRIKHWLADLEFSSAVTRQAQQVSPQMLIGNSSYLTQDGLGSGFFPSTIAREYFTPGNAQFDLWGASFMPWLRRICSFDALSTGVGGQGENTEALAAINRIEPILVINPATPTNPPVPTYYNGVPLSLMPGTISSGAESLSQAITEDVAMHGAESMLSASLWDKLLSWAAEYKFTIVPLVSTAIVVPQVAGQRAYWTTIYGQEYRNAAQVSLPPRPVRGVRLFGGINSPTGVLSALNTGGSSALPLFAGGYDNPDFPTGQFRFQNAPRWAANVAAPTIYGSATLLPVIAGGSALFPGAGAAPAMPAPQTVANQASGLWDAYARAVYIAETLRNRTGTLQGKLRFDIAPGSTVRIQVVAEKFVRQQTGPRSSDTVFAEVTSVSCHFDSDAMQASTTFGLANIRDSYENTIDSMSIDQHPFYAESWAGAPMCELTRPSNLAVVAFEPSV